MEWLFQATAYNYPETITLPPGNNQRYYHNTDSLEILFIIRLQSPIFGSCVSILEGKANENNLFCKRRSFLRPSLNESTLKMDIFQQHIISETFSFIPQK